MTLQISGSNSVPPCAVGVVANLTVINRTGDGNLVAFPANTSAFPPTSNLDFAPGQPLSNLVVSQLGESGGGFSGQVAFGARFENGGTADLVVDVLRYTT